MDMIPTFGLIGPALLLAALALNLWLLQHAAPALCRALDGPRPLVEARDAPRGEPAVMRLMPRAKGRAVSAEAAPLLLAA